MVNLVAGLIIHTYQDKNTSKIIRSYEFEEIKVKKFLAIDDVFGDQINIV
ncbi:MAG: hypothetical protein V7K48_32030 [Nostoc sp.]